jgi:predicted metal-dependent enzyme (double-stranded beta helix superfamily)
MDSGFTLIKDNITPFPGHPASRFPARQCAHGNYGLQPDCGPLVAELANTVQATLKYCQPHALSAAAKASLRGYLCEPDLLSVAHKKGDPDKHRRHLLYAAADGRFSILAIVWNPGQHTPVHGHTAWGATGVYEGNPYCDSYTLVEAEPKVLSLQATHKHRLNQGDIATVEPGLDDAHRIGNDTPTRAITIHIYGRDLLAKPGSINIQLDLN